MYFEAKKDLPIDHHIPNAQPKYEGSSPKKKKAQTSRVEAYFLSTDVTVLEKGNSFTKIVSWEKKKKNKKKNLISVSNPLSTSFN